MFLTLEHGSLSVAAPVAQAVVFNVADERGTDALVKLDAPSRR